jgi:O-acetyl-ADP-ribose deacetylase (regulator of RNase III)
MTITIEKRDLFTVPQGYYLAHCISADFALGAGIAKKFDEVYNMRFKLFREYDMYAFEGGDALLIDNVYNLVTKPRCYHKPRYEAIREALETMKDIMDFNSTTKLAMPKIASGLDRCDWNEVYGIICEVFEDTDVEILICEL